jgi:hypothetical protein
MQKDRTRIGTIKGGGSMTVGRNTLQYTIAEGLVTLQ